MAETYHWDQRINNGLGGYRSDQTGRVVKQKTVRDEFDQYINNISGDRFREIGQSFVDGKISLRDWQLQMRKEILNVHGNAAMDVWGGKDQMNFSRWGSVGGFVKRQYQWLDNFANEIATGKQKINGQLVVRCSLYGGAAETTRDKIERNVAKNSGWDEERNVLDPTARHCRGCQEEANKGWVPIGTLKYVGERDCLKNDKCYIEYRNSVTGERIQ